MSERRLHLYGVGTGKTGTHSVAAVFERDYRAGHEAEAKELMELLFEIWAGERPRSELGPYLRDRDRRLDLEVDADLVYGEVVGELVELFADARFVLTVREPWPWLDSMTNHSLARPTASHWARWRDVRFRADELARPPEEQAWAERGLYTLEGYLGSWARHNRLVLDAVPPERLLVIRTEDLGRRLGDLARFAGVDVQTLDADRVHSFPAAGRFDAVDDLDPDYVQDTIDRLCGEVLARLGMSGTRPGGRARGRGPRWRARRRRRA